MTLAAPLSRFPLHLSLDALVNKCKDIAQSNRKRLEKADKEAPKKTGEGETEADVFDSEQPGTDVSRCSLALHSVVVDESYRHCCSTVANVLLIN